MDNLKNKKIAIVGGGPGGLTLARLLQMKGADVTIYERDIDRNSRAQGATLDLHEESGLAALREAGLMKAFKANYRPGADRLLIVDKNAMLIWDDGETGDNGRGRPEIDRGPLQKILLDSLKPGTVVWDSQFVSLSSQNESWMLAFKNGSTVFADIVIAADGGNSKIRPYITPIKPFYAGYTAIEGAVYQSEKRSPKVHQLLKGGKIFAMGDEKTLIVSSKGDGSLVFYPCLKAEEQWVGESEIAFSDMAQLLEWFKREYKGWDELWLELFENASSPFVPRPLFCMPLDQTWKPLSNLTMLGDAAHLMPPFAGEGVNMAMLDALELSKCITSDDYPDLLTAITAFEQQMRIRATEAAKQSMESLVALHSKDAIDFMLSVIGQN